MPVSITIHDLPDETRAVLSARAARAGQSLENHVRAELIALAERPSSDEFWDRVRQRLRATRTSVPREFILEAKDKDRR
jgi:antitoxin FitA